VLSVVFAGCSLHRVVIEPAPAPTPAGPPSARGQIAARPGRPGAVVAAPHGTSDIATGEIAAEIARRTGFGLVVATGFSLAPDAPGRPGRRFQVNRPTEGVPGGPPADERATEAARQVYETYRRRVEETAAGPLVLYVEIHGNDRRESAGRIEIATVGIDAEYAGRLRTLCELIRDAYLRAQPKTPRLAVLVEPADRVFYAASATKRTGVLRLARRALHIELPKAARTEWRETYTAILADFVDQILVLPVGN
jgi:hypothetical protein